jgi:hypothetical protein
VLERSADEAERASGGTGDEPFEPTVGRADSMLLNVAGQVALERSYLAQLRGDAEGTAEFAAQVLARSGADEWLLRSTAQGFLAVAQSAMDEAGRAAPEPPGLLNQVPAQRARLLLAQGDLSGAAHWAQQSGLNADDEPAYPREAGHLLLARVLLAQDRPDAARTLLSRLGAAAAAQDRAGSVIEIGALRAQALAGAPSDPGPGRALRVAGLVNPPTSRELEVLRMLAVGQPTRPSHASSWSPWTPSRSMSAICWPSSARPTAPKPSPGRVSSGLIP